MEELKKFGQLLAVSSVWESAPVGYKNQDNYLNAVVLLGTKLSAESFQETAIPEIEASLGRVKGKNKYGPRTMDIDIMLVNDEILTLGHRPIPSPEILERAFVAIPLAEIEPLLRHPITGQRLEEIAAGFKGASQRLSQRKDINLIGVSERDNGKNTSDI
jgi:2-amino-4-hydroxy-6-hydroxymethyldihydropteridine diphosphokinase